MLYTQRILFRGVDSLGFLAFSFASNEIYLPAGGGLPCPEARLVIYGFSISDVSVVSIYNVSVGSIHDMSVVSISDTSVAMQHLEYPCSHLDICSLCFL